MTKLYVKLPTVITRVSEHLPEIVQYIQDIEREGFAKWELATVNRILDDRRNRVVRRRPKWRWQPCEAHNNTCGHDEESCKHFVHLDICTFGEGRCPSCVRTSLGNSRTSDRMIC
uniref:Uncharacterized protein n=1 Tax=Hyaloperonospora arabidopsidis (strain Emoy2) TaxID=559515 RepID=M4C6N9_HYAAE